MNPPNLKARRNAFALDRETNYTNYKIEEEAEERSSHSALPHEESREYITQGGTHLQKPLVDAFREVFDLFDSNGGGTIDAEELDLALRSVDIQLSQEEIIDVLTTMDRDGNGEIDFDEFLNLMTNTERFLEGLASDTPDKSDVKYRRRETMLFEALTNFMKKSALHSIDEIVGFYHTKYKRAQAPHVVVHYAAGARLIGLTEFQLRKHMETLREAKHHAAGHENSPYAEPLHIIFEHIPKKKPKKKDELPPRGRIRLRFNTTRFNSNGFPRAQSVPVKAEAVKVKRAPRSLTVPPCLLPRRRPEEQIKRSPKKSQGTGWKSQRIQPFPVELPVRCGRMNNLPGKLNAKVLSFDYIPAIRDKVEKAKEDFLERLHDRKKKESEQHWQALQTGNIHSDTLRNKFRMAFNAYTQFLQINDSRTQSEGNGDAPTNTNVQGRSKSVMEGNRNKSIQSNEIRSKSTA